LRNKSANHLQHLVLNETMKTLLNLGLVLLLTIMATGCVANSGNTSPASSTTVGGSISTGVSTHF
jgi:hypothetical protein